MQQSARSARIIRSTYSLASQTLDTCGGRVWSSFYAQFVSAPSANFLIYTGDSNDIHDQLPTRLAVKWLISTGVNVLIALINSTGVQN